MAVLPGLSSPSWQSLHFNRKHGREIANNGIPGITRVCGGVNLASSGAKIHATRVQRIKCHRVTEHVHIAIFLWKATGERLPLISSGTAAKHLKFSVQGEVLGVALD